MDDPYAALGDPVDNQSDPYAALGEPVDAAPADAAPGGPGFTDEQKQAILGYIPKAKDAADLEKFSLELSGGKAKIGNAQKVLDELKAGHKPEDFAFTPPTARADMAAPQPHDQLRDAVGEGIFNGLDAVMPGLGSLLRQNQAGGKAFTEHAANALAFDYGPEAGGFIDTVLHPDQYGEFGTNLDRNVAHERAIMAGDSQDHGVASAAGELTGIALPAMIGNEAGLANLPRLARGGAAATEGALYGSGAAGPGNRAEGAVTGAAIGGATEAAMPFVTKFIAAVKAGDHAGAAEAAKAAQELGIDLPRFIVGGEADARKAAALAQTVGGSKPISDATIKMLDQAEAARATIASSLGTAAEPAAMGDRALSGAVGRVRAERARIGSIYDQARAAADNQTFAATGTAATLRQLVSQEGETLGGTKAGGVFQDLLGDLEKRGGTLSIDGARATRTELRARLRDDAGVTPDNADRLTNLIMDSINGDIENGLKASGKDAAIPLYRQADAEWAKQRTLEDDVLKPFLGKDFDNWGEQVAAKIGSDAKGNGTRLAAFLRSIPEDEANNVRASLVMHLGSARPGAQNAAGEAFSLDTFLTNWNQIKNSRGMIYPPETVKALNKLAKVAEVAKVAGRKQNRSNTGGVVSYLMSTAPITLGGAETLLTHDPRGVALGLMAQALNAVRQYGAAKLLASPAFARKLAATPMNASGARAFWSRPWVKSLAVKEPAIAAEIKAFQSAFLSSANDNSGLLTSAAASPDANEQNQQQ